MAGPLAHICVLDLSRILAGPWASMTLADLGAEVIKVEQPGQGDDTRTWGPPFADAGGGQHGDAAYFLCVNRGKKSVTIDFTRPEGRDRPVAGAPLGCGDREFQGRGARRSTGSITRRCTGSIPASSIARSRASARPVPTVTVPVMTS